MKLRFLKHRLFAAAPEVKTGGGLFVTVEELLEQKRNVAYLKNFHQKLASSNMAGDVKSAFKGRGIELEEIRPYNFGDDIRDIDWRVTARKQQPYTRLYAEEKDREIYVLLDMSPRMAFGTRRELKSVAAAKIGALLGWMSLENKDRFGLGIYDGQKTSFFKAGNNRAFFFVMLKKISETSINILSGQWKENESFTKSVRLLDNQIKNRATVFILSDFSFFDEALRKSLARLAHKSRIYCLNIFDVLEEKAPPPGEYPAISPSGKKLLFNSGSTGFAKTYEDYFYNKKQEVKKFCSSFGIRYAEIRADLDIRNQLKIF